MARRRASRSRRGRWPLQFFIVTLLGLAASAYFGQGTLKNFDLSAIGLPKPATAQPEQSSPRPSSESTADVPQGDAVLVERVVDGDTLVIQGGDRVRLIGVDTPETHHPTKPAQPYGQEAFEFTRRMAEGKTVTLRFDPGETKDRYGRTLAYVYVDGEFLNEILIREGLARALTNYPFSADMKSVFRAAEAQAKAAKRGVWSLPQSPFEVGTKTSTKKAG